MRPTNKRTAQALLARQSRTISRNTVVTNEGEETVVRLHGNAIARHFHSSGVVVVSLAGWPTLTTRSRVNAICDTLEPYPSPHRLSFYQSKHVAHVMRGNHDDGRASYTEADSHEWYKAGTVASNGV